MLQPGQNLPYFDLPDHKGKNQTFDDLVGRRGLVVYFYPKDNTSGCTTEAMEFSADLTTFRRRGFNVLGVSKDSVRSHSNFVEKYKLRVPLLSDPDTTFIQAVGAWGKKQSRGRTYMGILRSTLVVDREGTVLLAYPSVKARGHAKQVLADIKDLT
ncbi:MAG: peroxiredoxin [Deltaproteobacteria bacterium]|nr:peroxiredoxin [Deltaproteobacteria bacterium]